ncbi:Z1 domain-containing protein [Leptolyngbya sp. ST-U4]|uniref:Z1 domain-containing protein n=1 Tax=Leptolyngbya sp. ST-U4 TaxID=2933912 RepID=UPI00329784F6
MNAYETARQIAQTLLKGERSIPREIIRQKVRQVIGLLPGLGFSEAIDEDALTRDLEELYNIWIGQPTFLDDEQGHEPWLPQSRADIDWDFWNRYRRYLEEEKGWSPFTVDHLEQLTDSILERLESPKRRGAWDRRGMVVGQVQSGKTSNYTGLVCKAADAGYRLIIVLAGLHSNLRSQTQLRLDEGFLGRDSQLQRRAEDTAGAAIGAGKIPVGKFLLAHSGTSSAENGDFSTKVANQLGLVPGGNDPILMVVKKNKTVLNNLLRWVVSLRGSQDEQSGKKIVRDIPLLVIDDEADNASVNTGQIPLDENGRLLDDQDPTAINGLIRKLLHSFEKSAYVGYTATPFANIFIHPEVRTSQYGDDLFPRHFIINLPAPSNYVGPVQVFGLDPDLTTDLDKADGLDIIRTVNDYQNCFPTGHKKDWVPSYLPATLKEAIRAFILTCAVRIWRGQGSAHNSMLVHVTRFTDVQERVAQMVLDELTALQRRLRYGDGNAPHQVLNEFRKLWEKDYVPTSESIIGTSLLPDASIPGWEDVADLLYQAAARIQVKQINGTARDILEYWENKSGLNVIAVGGDKLSRGLTLEGLSVSYYLRASKMYDTLMQMGRWFGYRPGYLDLCRLYTTNELVKWYRYITIASEELRQEFDYMAKMSSTPEEFGLKVRTHPSGLIITGVNKMRSGVTMQLSFAGSISETYLFSKDDRINQKNLHATEELISNVGVHSRTERDNYIWENVAPDSVVSFLSAYQTHPNARLANTERLLDYIKAQLRQNELTSWTIALISNARAEHHETIAGLDVGLTKRQDAAPDSSTEYRLVKSRLLSPLDEMLDLSVATRREVLELTRERRREDGKPDSNSNTPDGKIVREKRPATRGLLLLYPLDPEAIGSQTPVVGFVISFPGSRNAVSVEYKVNPIYFDQEFDEP